MPEDQTASRKPKTVTVILIVIAVLVAGLATAIVTGILLFFPARQEITRVQETVTETAEDEPAVETPVALTIEAEAEAVAEALPAATGDWILHVTSTETVTILQRPVIIATTDISAEQAGLSDQVASELASYASALTAPDGSRYTYYIQMLSEEGDIIGVVSSTDGRWKLYAPSAPTDAGALYAWLAQVYGPGAASSEPWVGRITAVAGGSSDPDGYVVITTDLDPANPADQRAAQTMIDAVNSSGASFAPGVRVIFSDGAFEWSSLLDGVDPYAP